MVHSNGMLLQATEYMIMESLEVATAVVHNTDIHFYYQMGLFPTLLGFHVF